MNNSTLMMEENAQLISMEVGAKNRFENKLTILKYASMAMCIGVAILYTVEYSWIFTSVGISLSEYYNFYDILNRLHVIYIALPFLMMFVVTKICNEKYPFMFSYVVIALHIGAIAFEFLHAYVTTYNATNVNACLGSTFCRNDGSIPSSWSVRPLYYVYIGICWGYFSYNIIGMVIVFLALYFLKKYKKADEILYAEERSKFV